MRPIERGEMVAPMTPEQTASLERYHDNVARVVGKLVYSPAPGSTPQLREAASKIDEMLERVKNRQRLVESENSPSVGRTFNNFLWEAEDELAFSVLELAKSASTVDLDPSLDEALKIAKDSALEIIAYMQTVLLHDMLLPHAYRLLKQKPQ